MKRETVDLSGFPDLVVIYLGMEVRTLVGLKTLFGFGPRIEQSAQAKPDGLLLHQTFLWSLFPPHVGIRQYWRDFASLESWARSEPHRAWWHSFVRDPGGTGFWHETYFMQGGMEAIYDYTAHPVGLGRFAPRVPAVGGMFNARKRAQLGGEPALSSPLEESELLPPPLQ